MIAMVGTLAGVVGCVCVFINPGVTMICAAICIACSFINVIRGEQKGFFTEIVGAGLGALIAVLADGDWLTGAAIGLCVESVLLWVIGIVLMLATKRR